MENCNMGSVQVQHKSTENICWTEKWNFSTKGTVGNFKNNQPVEK